MVKVFRLKYPKYKRLLWHTPNGGSRSGREASKLKRMGVVAGVPDLFLAVPCGHMHGLFMEVKKPGGDLSDEQVKQVTHILAMGFDFAVVESTADMLNAVDEYFDGRLE